MLYQQNIWQAATSACVRGYPRQTALHILLLATGSVAGPSWQRDTVAAGIAAASKAPNAAKGFIKFITAPEAAPVLKAKGFESG